MWIWPTGPPPCLGPHRSSRPMEGDFPETGRGNKVRLRYRRIGLVETAWSQKGPFFQFSPYLEKCAVRHPDSLANLDLPLSFW